MSSQIFDAQRTAMQKLASFFFEDCQINIGSPVPNIVGKNELVATASQMRQLVNNIDVLH